MKKSLIALACFGLLSSLTHAADLTGIWRTIDDKRGIVRAHIQIEKQADGSYTGTLIEDFPAAGETPLTKCNNCPAPYTNKPIIGLTVLKNLKADPENPNVYMGGSVLDPRGGKIYHGKAKLNASGNKMTLRGYMGISIVGRSQTWIRQE